MITEIKQFLLFLFADPEGKHRRNGLLLFLAFCIIALLVSFQLISPIVSDDLRFDILRSKIFFMNNQDPYGEDVENFLEQTAEEEGWEISANQIGLENPAWNLTIFLPFQFINQYPIAESLFISVNIIALFFACHSYLKVLQEKPNQIELSLIFMAVLLLATTFGMNLFVSTAPIQLLILVLCFRSYFRKKYIAAGILFGLSFFHITNVFIPLCLLFIFFMKSKKWNVLLWWSITNGILVIFTLVFNRIWYIGFFSNILLSPSFFPMKEYALIFSQNFNLTYSPIINTIPVLFLAWMIIEFIRTPEDSNQAILWLLNIFFALQIFTTVNRNTYQAIFLIPCLLQILTVWMAKITKMKKIYFLILIICAQAILVYFGLNENNYLSRGNLTIIWIITAILLMNLYWLRFWILKPYENTMYQTE